MLEFGIENKKWVATMPQGEQDEKKMCELMKVSCGMIPAPVGIGEYSYCNGHP